MEPEGLLPCLQQSATETYPKPAVYSPNSHTLFI
jgi:hypothetical protein